MIRYLKNNEINSKSWDDCISASSIPLVYAHSWYLDMVSPGWGALVLDDYKAVFPLTHSRKFGFSYLRQPFFCQQLGIFSDDINEKIVSDFFQFIPGKYKLIDINLNVSNNFEPCGYQIKKNLNLELPLQKSYPELFKYFSDNTRRNIRKSASANFNLTTSIRADAFIEMFRQNKGRQIKKFPIHAWQVLKNIIETSLVRKQGILYGVEHPDYGLCAGAFFLLSGSRAIFLFSALSEEGKHSGAMYFLVNEFISRHAGSSLVLDFEGSNEPSLARFYKGFGAIEKNYLRVWKNSLPFPLRYFKRRPW